MIRISIGKIFLLVCLVSQVGFANKNNSSAKSEQASSISLALGEWAVDEIVDMTSAPGMDDKEMNTMPGKVLSLKNESAIFANRNCKDPKYSIKIKKTFYFF